MAVHDVPRSEMDPGGGSGPGTGNTSTEYTTKIKAGFVQKTCVQAHSS